MLAYRVTQGGLRENMAFLIEPDLGRVSEPSAMVLPVGAAGFTWRGARRTYVYTASRVSCLGSHDSPAPPFYCPIPVPASSNYGVTDGKGERKTRRGESRLLRPRSISFRSSPRNASLRTYQAVQDLNTDSLGSCPPPPVRSFRVRPPCPRFFSSRSSSPVCAHRSRTCGRVLMPSR